jgi:hypothetical protein
VAQTLAAEVNLGAASFVGFKGAGFDFLFVAGCGFYDQTNRRNRLSAPPAYKQAADKSWSLTDCASFQVMEAEQMQGALTHDQYFAQAGFETLLR